MFFKQRPDLQTYPRMQLLHKPVRFHLVSIREVNKIGDIRLRQSD
jgi:hypothetical protein